MSKPKYQIELELQGEDLTGYFALSRFIGATTLVAEGDWISDLLQDATVLRRIKTEARVRLCNCKIFLIGSERISNGACVSVSGNPDS